MAEDSSGREAGSLADLSELIVTTSADGIVAVDDGGIIRLCNRAAQDLLSRSQAELVGTPFGLPVVGRRTTEIELMQPGGGERVVEMRTTTATLEGSRLHIVSLRDVTGRKQAEHDLEAALEQRSVVLAVAAHEFHGPLAAISILAQTLAEQLGRPTAAPADEQVQIIQRIIDLASRLQLLTRRLMTAARIDTGGVPPSPEPVPVLEAIVEQVAYVAAKPGDVRVSCSPGLVVRTDRAEFGAMLGNYLDNALTHGRPPVEIRATERDKVVEIRVSDCGPGVPESFVPRLFDRFARVAAPGSAHRQEGTGLGLWIVATFATANGGAAWYEPGPRSAFCLRLPIARVA